MGKPDCARPLALSARKAALPPSLLLRVNPHYDVDSGMTASKCKAMTVDELARFYGSTAGEACGRHT